MKHSINFLVFLLFCFIGNSQAKLNDTLSYQDKFGDEIIIRNPENFSFPFDSEFLKANLNSSYFLEKPTKYKYRLNIEFIKTLRKKRKYKIGVRIYPQIEKPYKEEDVREILKFMGGSSFYELIFKKDKGKYFIDSVKYLYSTI